MSQTFPGSMFFWILRNTFLETEAKHLHSVNYGMKFYGVTVIKNMYISSLFKDLRFKIIAIWSFDHIVQSEELQMRTMSVNRNWAADLWFWEKHKKMKTFAQRWPSGESRSSRGALQRAGGGYRAEAHCSSSRLPHGSQCKMWRLSAPPPDPPF